MLQAQFLSLYETLVVLIHSCDDTMGCNNTRSGSSVGEMEMIERHNIPPVQQQQEVAPDGSKYAPCTQRKCW